MASTKNRDEMLRRIARNRGLRLVKSRRRNPKHADFGRYGLIDAESGDKVFGFARTRVKATADEIEEWLRQDTAADWKRSLRNRG